MVEILNIDNNLLKEIDSNSINFHFASGTQTLSTNENTIRVMKNVVIESQDSLGEIDFLFFAPRAYLNFERIEKWIIFEDGFINLNDLGETKIKEFLLNKKEQRLVRQQIVETNKEINNGSTTIENLIKLDKLEEKYIIGKLVFKEYKNIY